MKEAEIILKYAGGKFFSEGFHKISMDEIARGLGISKKTIYKYFPSKDKLIESLIDYEIEIHLIKEISILKSDLGVMKKIVEFIHYNLNEFSKYNNKWLNDLQIHKPELWAKYMDFKDNNYDCNFKKIMQEGKKEKLIKDIPTVILMLGIESIVRNVINRNFLLINNLSIRQALNYALDILISGILTDRGLKQYRKEKKLFKI